MLNTSRSRLNKSKSSNNTIEYSYSNKKSNLTIDEQTEVVKLNNFNKEKKSKDENLCHRELLDLNG